jgi:hypothetical protein
MVDAQQRLVRRWEAATNEKWRDVETEVQP